MNRPLRVFALGFGLFISILSPAVAQEVTESTPPLTMQQLIDSIREYHPVILSARSRREQTDTAPQRARGAFDLNINQSTLSRVNGFYDGQYLEQGVVQPLEIAGADIKATYRISDGNFPTYQDLLNTTNAGEASIGVSLSLLRDRDVDDRRAGLFEADFTQSIGVIQEQLTINQLLFEGLNSYLNWYQATLVKGVAESLVELAETRREAIETRVENGDLAAITITEFETTLLTRQIVLQETLQDLLRAQQQLLFYWRGEGSSNYSASDLNLPELPIAWPFDDYTFDLAWQNRIIDAHPTVNELDAELQIARNQARLKENNLLPQLDLEFQLGNDFGSGINSLDGPESYVGLNFSVPLQRNRAKAERTAAVAKVSELEYSRRVQVDRLTLSLNESLLQLIERTGKPGTRQV